MTYIRLTDVSVHIPIYDSQSARLIKLPSFGHAKVGTDKVSYTNSAVLIHALRNMNLEFSEGDRVCLMGHNGSGKTTLLRILAGIYPATSGRVEVSGNVFALLGSGAMINNDATGYENIRLTAHLHNWPKKQFEEYVQDIEEFTELGEYLSLPTRVYSNGMQARLAFALATARTPDILLIDEGIGAGDHHFQEKARVRIQRFVSQARILLLASHSIELCRALCTKALLLSKGEQTFFGDIDEAYEKYTQMTVEMRRARMAARL
jgi:ABC-2 type transport system ATP-binding protein/lipopolysaccharide transport system ATP-binding protein